MKSKCLCTVKFCRNKRAPGRLICHKHKTARWREQRPFSALFHRCKGHAKERRVEWLLTIEEFTTFCLDSDYHNLRGNDRDDATIDRIRGDEPYKVGNLQIITRVANTYKAHWDGARKHLQGYVEPETLVDSTNLFG